MRILVGMSGGVDSSVAAALLQKEGHEIAGVYIKHGIGSVFSADEQDAQAVAGQLGISLYVLDAHEAFQNIVDNFVCEYLSCRTPNPCVLCNRTIKFGLVYDFALSKGFNAMATGHYARCDQTSDRFGNPESAIFEAVNAQKDQSYVLFGIEREKLQNLFFPLGQFKKEDIRQMARDWGLKVANKKDSQDICFIPDGDHAAFVNPYKMDATGRTLNTSGHFVTLEGKVVGSHEGIERYTVGQRKGLGVAMNQRYFVTRLDPVTNNVILGTHEQLGRRTFEVQQANWQTDLPDDFRCWVKIRYKFTPVVATVRKMQDSQGLKTRFQVETDENVYGVAPGQAAVCYDGPRVLGGGWICQDA